MVLERVQERNKRSTKYAQEVGCVGKWCLMSDMGLDDEVRVWRVVTR